jgi:hypothetical protein
MLCIYTTGSYCHPLVSLACLFYALACGRQDSQKQQQKRPPGAQRCAFYDVTIIWARAPSPAAKKHPFKKTRKQQVKRIEYPSRPHPRPAPAPRVRVHARSHMTMRVRACVCVCFRGG